jgi:L-alanine-DL-glutamate epimerase-like enolase superfamily enzyme
MWVAGEMIFRDPPNPVRGTVTLPERPGLGLEPNEDALRDTLER